MSTYKRGREGQMTPAEEAYLAEGDRKPWPVCNQANCENPALFRFTWPGEDEKMICPEHLPKLQALIAALNLKLQIRFVADLEAQLDRMHARGYVLHDDKTAPMLRLDAEGRLVYSPAIAELLKTARRLLTSGIVIGDAAAELDLKNALVLVDLEAKKLGGPFE